jgi:flagellin-like hook-associated protein FlgL
VAVTLGKNVSSLRAQRALNDATSQLSKTYERLSSGLRINRASDDAAGLAVADTLNVKSRLFAQSSRNINDGVSLLNIGDSALGEVSSVLTRMIELAEQAANGTFSSTQRSSLNKEFTQLREEIYRIGQTTEFNGIRLFAGEVGVDLQVGINGSSTSRIRTTGTTLEDGSWVLDRSVFFDPSDGDLDGVSGDNDYDSQVSESTLESFYRGNLLEFSTFDSQGNARNVKIGISFDSGGSLVFQTFVESATNSGSYNRSNDTNTEMNRIVAGQEGSFLIIPTAGGV